MNRIYNNIVDCSKKKDSLLSVLIDPDKVFLPDLKIVVDRINESNATHIFVGGSTVKEFVTDTVVERIKRFTDLPVVIFPGDTNQITDRADALLFLNLISGRNPEYLISKQIEAAYILRKLELEIISTSYILIGLNNYSSVERVSGTRPLDMNNIEAIVNTAVAGELIGHKLIYLEAGSGALQSVGYEILQEVKRAVNIPVLVGGGFNNLSHIEKAYNYGADMVVIGTAFENNLEFFKNNHILNSRK